MRTGGSFRARALALARARARAFVVAVFVVVVDVVVVVVVVVVVGVVGGAPGLFPTLRVVTIRGLSESSHEPTIATASPPRKSSAGN